MNAAAGADDDDAAAGASDFAVRAEDGDEDDGDGAMVVASPKARARAALIAAGDASFERMRLLERVLRGDADLFAPVAAVAAAFCFLGMGICGSRRADGWRFRQARDVVESEDRAEKRVVMCGAEEFAAAPRACTR